MSDELQKRLHTMVDRNRLPHGLLFVGSTEEEKIRVAFTLAKYLLGLKTTDNKIEDGNHPDVQVLKPEKQEITIDQVRGFQRWLMLGAYEGENKVGIIAQADALNVAASNALLKILEEPPSHVTLILISASADNLLSTVVSRLSLIRFPEKYDDPAKANEEMPEWLNGLEEVLRSKKGVKSEVVFQLTQKISKDKANMPIFFSIFERHLRDELYHSSSIEHARKVEKLFDETIVAERQVLKRYGNAALHLDRLLLQWTAP